MKKIMFTCLGNICRSPLAHTVFEELIKKENIPITVDSTGIGNWHQGQNADPRIIDIATKNGYHVTHLAKQLTTDDLKEFDIIFSMAEDVTHSITAHFDPLFLYKNKIMNFRSFDPLSKGSLNVPDPYHEQDEKAFEEVFIIVERTVKEIIKKIKENEL